MSQLHQSPKSLCSTENLKLADLVPFKNKFISVFQWKLGRIIETFSVSDVHVRVDIVRTDTGEFKRPSHKPYPLWITAGRNSFI